MRYDATGRDFELQVLTSVESGVVLTEDVVDILRLAGVTILLLLLIRTYESSSNLCESLHR